MDELYVVKGRPNIPDAPLSVLAVTNDREEADRHVEALLDQPNFFAFIQTYIPAEAKFFCAEHAMKQDSPIICIVCSQPARFARFATDGQDNDQRH